MDTVFDRSGSKESRKARPHFWSTLFIGTFLLLGLTSCGPSSSSSTRELLSHNSHIGGTPGKGSFSVRGSSAATSSSALAAPKENRIPTISEEISSSIAHVRHLEESLSEHGLIFEVRQATLGGHHYMKAIWQIMELRKAEEDGRFSALSTQNVLRTYVTNLEKHIERYGQVRRYDEETESYVEFISTSERQSLMAKLRLANETTELFSRRAQVFDHNDWVSKERARLGRRIASRIIAVE